MEKEEFKRLLDTVRLSLDDEEIVSMQKDIEEIISFFDKIDKVQIEGVEKAFHPVEIPEKLREDSTEGKENLKDTFENSDNYRFYFLGPKV